MTRGGYGMKRFLVSAACAAVLTGVGATGALAGEVKGPPNQQDNENRTGAPANANSECAFSGLNDFDPDDPIGLLNDTQVQTAADSWKIYGLPKGTPGQACNGHLSPRK